MPFTVFNYNKRIVIAYFIKHGSDKALFLSWSFMMLNGIQTIDKQSKEANQLVMNSSVVLIGFFSIRSQTFSKRGNTPYCFIFITWHRTKPIYIYLFPLESSVSQQQQFSLRTRSFCHVYLFLPLLFMQAHSYPTNCTHFK